MKQIITPFIVAITVAQFSIHILAADGKVTAPGAVLEKLGDGFSFTEGPACDPQGNVFFTDQPNDRILKWDVEEKKLSTFMQPAGRANGMFFDAAGNLIACADEKNELWSINPTDKKVTIWVKDYSGKLLNGPNDVWGHPQGGYYFTDPFYKRDYWKRGAMEQDGQHVYYWNPKTKELRRVVSDLKQPNGIIGTPDGQTLFVADIGASKTYQFKIQPDKSLTDKKLFCEMGSDGMTLDSEGHLYLTGRGVTVFDQDGKKVEVISVPGGWTANVCFGGKDRQTLFITSSKCFYSIQMSVKGAAQGK